MLTVLMPSRGRERQATEALEAFGATKTLSDTQMVIVLDEFEPGYDDLPAMRFKHDGGMGNALNAAVAHFGAIPPGEKWAATMFGFVGDDHRFRTEGWDEAILEANEKIGGGIVYGNDLIRGEELPSAAFVDARITRALGWMALPGATHLYFDDTWRELGRAMGRLKYKPNVIIEHMHPIAGKADWDENYARVNDQKVYDHDKDIYDLWYSDQRRIDAQTALDALR